MREITKNLYSFRELEEMFPEAAEKLVKQRREDMAQDYDLLQMTADDIKDELCKVFGKHKGRSSPSSGWAMYWALDGHSRGVVCEGIRLSTVKVEAIRGVIAKDPGCIFDCGTLPESYEPEDPGYDGEACVQVMDAGRYNILRFERMDSRSTRDDTWCEQAEAYLTALHENILERLESEYEYHASAESAKTYLTDEGEVFTEDGERDG